MTTLAAERNVEIDPERNRCSRAVQRGLRLAGDRLVGPDRERRIVGDEIAPYLGFSRRYGSQRNRLTCSGHYGTQGTIEIGFMVVISIPDDYIKFHHSARLSPLPQPIPRTSSPEGTTA